MSFEPNRSIFSRLQRISPLPERDMIVSYESREYSEFRWYHGLYIRPKLTFVNLGLFLYQFFEQRKERKR